MNEIIDNLWIGDIWDAQEGDTSQFDAVITICQDDVRDNVACTYHQFPLSDGPAPRDAYNPGVFEYELFEEAVDTIIEHVERGDCTFVHCHAGQSRSVIACTCALVVLEDTYFDDAFWTVRASRGNVSPSDEIRHFGTKYTNNRMI